MRNVIVDFSEFEIADDEHTATAHYGGAIYAREGDQVKHFYPSGSDRSADFWENLRAFLVGLGLNFDQIEQRIQAEADAKGFDVGDMEEWFNLYYLENIGTHVLITAEDDGTVIKVEEHIPLRDRVAALIEKNLAEMLNGPGTHMAYDDELDFGYKWEDGQTTVFLEHEGQEIEYKFKIQVVKA